MSRTIIDDETLEASGGADSATRTFTKERRKEVALHVTSSDGSATDITVDLSGVKVFSDKSVFATPNTTESYSNVNGNGLGVRLVESDGYEEVQVSVTNNLASAVQVTVEAEGYS